MGTADEQIRVSNTVKRELEKRKRKGESYNDVLERVLGENVMGDFYDGFGRWSDEESQSVREARQKAKEKRKKRMRRRADNSA
ncbi:antitoxin VapB family protein [Natronosalvus rutilus]|uniref:Antitoxin VapB family protein n=1 Tax=Natronosalvus rutilus TaxID=2953753 RepID=A0A9E7NE26_9EURY|nr:antitoxin VapB family protein [Natronosalvus rutilus]UTF55626.1 antitoxin VapB family protein [Natronosalvus rutilus]